MEPKTIGVISNNLEIIRKVVEDREETTKKVFKDIISGDDVKTIVTSFLDKLDEVKIEAVEMRTEMGSVKDIMKKNAELMSKDKDNGSKKILTFLKPFLQMCPRF